MVACFDAVRLYIYLSLFFEHYNRILLYDCALGHCSVVRLRVCMSQCIRTLPGLEQFRN